MTGQALVVQANAVPGPDGRGGLPLSDGSADMASDLLEWAEKRPRGAANTRGHGRPNTVRSGRRGSAYLGCRMKRCPRCGQDKLFSEFYPDRRSKTGYRSWCKTCISQSTSVNESRKRYWASERGKQVKRRYRQNHLLEVRAEDEARRQVALARLDRIKLERGCADCGYCQHPAALDFDHRDPTKKTANISRIVRYDWAVLLAEIAKCDVRCANCHRVRTVQNKHSGRRREASPDENQGRLL